MTKASEMQDEREAMIAGARALGALLEAEGHALWETARKRMKAA